MYRFVSSIFQTAASSTLVGSLSVFITLVFGGFLIKRTPGHSHDIISHEKYSQLQGSLDNIYNSDKNKRPTFGSPTSSIGHEKGRLVLPFEPLTVTFENVQYYVDTPLEMRKGGFLKKKLQLLSDITGAFRPGILTAVMGASGARNTTLMDVLSGRKTLGTVEGEIKIDGYPKVQNSFARISGYCEQNDIHSPQITVEEPLVYSAWLWLPPDIHQKTKSEFVVEVLQTIELDGIKDSLVGIPGVSGLSTEQRKRLTIAVELVANPSIIFMDEPTSGLDTRAAAIVMRAVKNVAETGRTVVCTIHLLSIDIFEAFEELVLMKLGGCVIYSGPLGRHSSKVLEYLRENRELVKQLSSPTPASKELHFSTCFPQNGWEQLKACIWKQYLSYWRSPAYNLRRIFCIFATSVIYGLLFWKQGQKINNHQDLFNVLGSMYSAIMTYGISNCSAVLPYVAAERAVLYRERFAGMYSSWAYSFAQVLVEVPNSLAQAIIYVPIASPMIGYSSSVKTILRSIYVMFCTLLSYNYFGMLLVSMTSGVEMATILTSPFYSVMNLFSGFIVPRPYIPKWWIWLYCINPTSWALNGLLTSQYGDIEKEISVFGQSQSVAALLRDYFGFRQHLLSVVAVVLVIFPVVFASLFAYAYFIRRHGENRCLYLFDISSSSSAGLPL